MSESSEYKVCATLLETRVTDVEGAVIALESAIECADFDLTRDQQFRLLRAILAINQRLSERTRL